MGTDCKSALSTQGLFFISEPSGKWVKVSVIGDISGIDFYHTNKRDKDGFQLTFATDRKGNWATIRKGREVLSGQLRGNDVNWKTIYNEWNTDTGPERSVFEGKHPANFAIHDNYLYGRAHSKFVNSGESKKGYEANFYYVIDNIRSGNNMQIQMMGTYNVSFYKLGNNVLNIIQDSKSRESFYLHLPLHNYKRGQGYIGENGMWYPPIQGENNTWQTYIFMTNK